MGASEVLIERLNRGVRKRNARWTFVSDVPFGDALRLRRFRLGNGLTVLSLIDRSAPTVSYHSWFRVGSRHERPGKTGLAHLFEHLMFNGSENHDEEYFTPLQQVGDEEADQHVDDEGRIVRDNVFGDIEGDAFRRDFSVNALYYNIADFSIIDYTGGMADIEKGVLRLIGDPDTRFREDPVRMLRAVRFATKLGFRIDAGTEHPIKTLAPLLGDIPPARLFDEMLKLFLGGSALDNFEMLRHFDLFGQLFPLTERALSHEENHFPLTLIARGMANTDKRIEEGKPVTPAFLFALFLWQPVRERAAKLEAEGQHPAQAMQHAGSQIIAEQAAVMATPRRFSLPMRDIWMLQLRLENKGGRRSVRALGHPRFRAAYDFLLLRAAAGEVPQDLADWWTKFQETHADQTAQPAARSRPRKRRRNRPRRKPEGQTG